MAGSTVVLQLRREGSGTSHQWTNTHREGTQETELGFLCCLVLRPEPLGTKWNRGVFLTSGNTFSQWGGLSTGRGWPERCGIHQVTARSESKPGTAQSTLQRHQSTTSGAPFQPQPMMLMIHELGHHRTKSVMLWRFKLSLSAIALLNRCVSVEKCDLATIHS